MSMEFIPPEKSMTDPDTGENNIKRMEKEICQFKNAAETKFGSEDYGKILDALNLMLFLHCEQKNRLDGNPYMSHPLEVADDLIDKYDINDAELIIAALLHDSIEDQAYKLLSMRQSDDESGAMNEEELRNMAFANIGKLYGGRVQRIIEGLTNPDFDKMIGNLEPEEKQKAKIRLYEEHIKKAIEDPDVFIVKLSDFMRNAGNIPSEGRKRDYFIKKYGPVIKDVFIPAFEGMSEAHPLYGVKTEILTELNKLYAIDYKADFEG